MGLERALFTMLGGGDAGPVTSIATGKDGSPVDPTAGAASPAGTAVLSVQSVKDHPTVAAFEATLGKNRRISYLPSRAFSAAVLDILAPPAVVILDSIPAADVPPAAAAALAELRVHPDEAHLRAFEDLLAPDSALRGPTVLRLETAITGDVLGQARTAVDMLPVDNPARRTLIRMLTDAGSDRDAFRAKLEHWYDDEMSRLTGWYKRYVQRFIIGYGVALTIIFNVDTISIAQTLWRSPVEQAAVAQAAASTAGKTVEDVDTSIAAIKRLAFPLGWTPAHTGSSISNDPRHVPATAGSWGAKLLGLIITAFALAFGAPFWFDVLGKIARVRNAGGVASTTEDTKRA
jgi:hypothetical protein